MNVIRGDSGIEDIVEIVAEDPLKGDIKTKRRGRLKQSVAINAFVGVSSLVVALVVFPGYTTVLGLDKFGIILVGLAVATIVVNLDLGMGAVISRRAAYIGSARFSRDYSVERATARLRLIAVAPAAVLALYGFLSGIADIGGYAAVLAFSLFGGFLPVAFRSAQARYEGAGEFFVPRAYILASSGLRLSVAFTVSHVPAGAQIAVVLIAECSVLWLPAIGSAIAMKRASSEVKDSPLHEGWSSLSIYGAGSCLSAIVGALVLNVDTLVVGAVLTPAAVVVFAAGSRVIQVYRQVVGWVMQPLLSRLMSIHGISGNPGLRVVWRGFHPAAIFAFAGVGFAILAAGFVIIPVLLPSSSADDVRDARQILVLLCGGAVISASHQIGILVLTASRKPLSLVPSQLAWAALRATMGAILGSMYGVVAAGFGILVATILIEPSYLLRIGRVLELPRSEILARAGLPAICLCTAIVGFGYCAIYSQITGLALIFASAGFLFLSAWFSVRKLSQMPEWRINV
jgi:O-antigen/teichoic acid export membrane protein